MNAMPPGTTRGKPKVLSTLEADGSRRWLKPRLSHGPNYVRRRGIAAFLILVFTGLPFLRIDGQPAFLLDVLERRFTVFGTTFFATDGTLVGLLVVAIFLTIFLLTTLFGRVWCGYACPQTVYLEFVYRPVERFFDRLAARDSTEGPVRLSIGLRVIRFIVWLAISAFLANTFLAYFVGIDRLAVWITRSPLEHPGSFAVMAVTTILMLVDFTFFREQLCTLTCPYGRFQSVMFDRATRIVAYDAKRGEPRAKIRADGTHEGGDCIDCRACVATCPTGIDIRDGLQMECVACTQCIDACDSIMAKIGRPAGLVRNASLEELEGKPRRWLRPRIFVYLALIAGAVSALSILIASRGSIDAVFLRTQSTPYRETSDGTIDCPIRLRLANRTASAQSVRLVLGSSGSIEGGPRAVELGAYEIVSIDRSIVLPKSAFSMGRASLELRIESGPGESVLLEKTLIGPLGVGPEDGEREGGEEQDR